MAGTIVTVDVDAPESDEPGHGGDPDPAGPGEPFEAVPPGPPDLPDLPVTGTQLLVLLVVAAVLVSVGLLLRHLGRRRPPLSQGVDRC